MKFIPQLTCNYRHFTPDSSGIFFMNNSIHHNIVVNLKNKRSCLQLRKIMAMKMTLPAKEWVKMKNQKVENLPTKEAVTKPARVAKRTVIAKETRETGNAESKVFLKGAHYMHLFLWPPFKK